MSQLMDQRANRTSGSTTHPRQAGRLEEVAAALAAHGLDIRAARPCADDDEHVYLELACTDGEQAAGQWFADADRARTAADETRVPRGRAGGGIRQVAEIPAGNGVVVVQHAGADRVLTALADLAAFADAAIVTHRPEQRATVRRTGGGSVTYTRVVPADRTDAISQAAGYLEALDLADGGSVGVPVTTPPVLAVDAAAGLVTYGEVQGRSLRDLVCDPAVDDCALASAGRTAGMALRRLHGAPLPPHAEVHDATTELGATARWALGAATFGALPTAHAALLLARLRTEFESGPSAPIALLHGHLNDRDVLIDDTGAVGVAGFDGLEVGDPARDLAPLLAHIQLRAHDGACSRERAALLVHAIRAGYVPSPVLHKRLAAYDLAARIRLYAAYSFRPAPQAAAAARLVGELAHAT